MKQKLDQSKWLVIDPKLESCRKLIVDILEDNLRRILEPRNHSYMEEHDILVIGALLGELKAIQTLVLRQVNPDTPEADGQHPMTKVRGLQFKE